MSNNREDQVKQTVADIMLEFRKTDRTLTYDDIITGTGRSMTQVKYAMTLYSDLFFMTGMVKKFRYWELTEKAIDFNFEKTKNQKDYRFDMLVFFYTKCTQVRGMVY